MFGPIRLGVLVAATIASTPSPHPPGWGYPPRCGSICVVAPPQPAKLGTARRLFDSVDLSAFPANPFAAGGYVGGVWVTFPAIRARWPKTHAVSFAINASERAACLDIEPGDATPAEAPAWDRARIREGRKPCEYSSYWEFVNEVRPVTQRAGLKRSQILEIDADYLGCPRLDKGFDGTQCTDHALGRNLDESVVTERFLRIATPPYRPHARQIAALRARRTLNQHRRARQHCGHIRAGHGRARARCRIEQARIAGFDRQIKRLERS